MQENDNSEILKNNSSVRVTATAALYKDIKMDNFNLNSSLNSQTDIKNCHSSQSSSSSSSSRESDDNEFHLIKYSIPLRPKIKQIQYRISNEIIKLQNIFNDLKTQDDDLIKKLNISLKENNIQYSLLISSELNGNRKSIRAIWTSKIVLDTLHNQICNISSFKDLVENITPSLTVLKSIRSLLISHIRESDHEFKNISDLLCDVLFNAGQLGGYLINFKIANNAAVDITDDAIFKAENKIKIEFLPIPKVTS
jgi:hypothetical protein